MARNSMTALKRTDDIFEKGEPLLEVISDKVDADTAPAIPAGDHDKKLVEEGAT